ncbi:hypothetical protein HOY82DRAFT_542130 [Tuber indicum]|nr:hypothetical protein HOY82DRAFT_542130 [Tuber indicum]
MVNHSFLLAAIVTKVFGRALLMLGSDAYGHTAVPDGGDTQSGGILRTMKWLVARSVAAAAVDDPLDVTGFTLQDTELKFMTHLEQCSESSSPSVLEDGTPYGALPGPTQFPCAHISL